MMKFAFLCAIVLCSVLTAEACYNNPYWTNNNSPPPPPTPAPTNQPTKFPTRNPTEAPSKTPTRSPTPWPTPEPTPPPPPPPYIGYFPSPPTPQTEQGLSQCFKRVEFVISVGATRRFEVQEKWIYDCEFQVCTAVQMFEITEYTNCGCGMTLAMPPPGNTNGPVSAAYDISIHSARAVAFHRVTRQELGPLPGWTFEPTQQTTELLEELSTVPNANWTKAVAGFSGLIAPWPELPAILDINVPGQEDHVSALCFTVLQSYQSDYKWPEPPFPSLYSPPNVYMTDCIPWDPQPDETSLIHFRDIYIFSDDSSDSGGGSQTYHRYLTAFYLNNHCEPKAGYVTIEREFTSFLRRAEKPGCFRWIRNFERNWLIGGAPRDLGSVEYYYANGARNVTYQQAYTRNEITCEEDPLYGVDQGCVPDNSVKTNGVLYHALLGQSVNGVPPASAGVDTKLCNALPSNWATCVPGGGDSYCAQSSRPEAKFNDFGEQTFRWPLPWESPVNNEVDAIDCAPMFVPYAMDETYMCYQNFGVTDRDFTKSATSWLVTGERDLFGGIVDNSALDELKLAPVPEGAIEPSFQIPGQLRRKRHASGFYSERHNDPFSANFHDELAPRSKRIAGASPRTFIRKRGILEETDNPFVEDPPAAGIPQQQPGVTQFVVGSSDENGLPAGDHPVQLFPETFTLPISMDPTDTACGSYPGDVITQGCGAKRYSGFPPCIEGQLGCSCRQSPGRPECDLPYECRGGGFCVKPQCPKGAPGCACQEGGCDGEFVKCNTTIDRCYYDVGVCAPGTPGCPCALRDGEYDFCQQGSSQYNCTQGICKNTNLVSCNAGTGGCVCAGTNCQNEAHACSDFGECVSKAFCELGSPGCTCAVGGRCTTEMSCDAGMNMCVQPECPAGEVGCPCLKSDGQCTCNTPGYNCEFLYDMAEGSPCDSDAESACMAKLQCDRSQAERCISYCGNPNNVLRCPTCEHEIPQCIDYNGASALGASVWLFALVAVALALLQL